MLAAALWWLKYGAILTPFGDLAMCMTVGYSAHTASTLSAGSALSSRRQMYAPTPAARDRDDAARRG
jgi:hypothetical protein